MDTVKQVHPATELADRLDVPILEARRLWKKMERDKREGKPNERNDNSRRTGPRS